MKRLFKFLKERFRYPRAAKTLIEILLKEYINYHESASNICTFTQGLCATRDTLFEKGIITKRELDRISKTLLENHPTLLSINDFSEVIVYTNSHKAPVSFNNYWWPTTREGYEIRVKYLEYLIFRL